MYQVLARKWRPKNFHELVGQQHVTQALTYALNHDRIHHAYLFTGTRGVGKTTIARIFAKSLNCLTHGVSAEPCGDCAHCREIDSGRFPDLLEVDAASRTGVDDTRELLDNVPYAPVKGRFKVYLIDEVHMFSKSSFNALLKTLEEPPAHVKFILATTDPQKMPATVLSRCLQFHLKNMTSAQISEHLRHILRQDQVPYEDDAVMLLAEAGAGSMRDSLSLLDQAIAYGRGAVRGGEVAQLLGAIPHTQLRALLQALCDGEASALRRILAELDEFAPDYHELLQRLLLLLQQITVAQLEAQRFAGEVDAEMVALAARLPVELVQLWYQIATDGWQSLPYQPDSRLAVEMILLRMIALRPILPMADVARIKPISEAEPAQEDETTALIKQAQQSAADKPGDAGNHPETAKPVANALSAPDKHDADVSASQPKAEAAETAAVKTDAQTASKVTPEATMASAQEPEESAPASLPESESAIEPIAKAAAASDDDLPPWVSEAPAYGDSLEATNAAKDTAEAGDAAEAESSGAAQQGAPATQPSVTANSSSAAASVDIADCVDNSASWAALLRGVALPDELGVIVDHSTIAQWQAPNLTLAVDSGAWFMVTNDTLTQLSARFSQYMQAPCQVHVQECGEIQNTPARQREAAAANEQQRAEQAFHDHPVVHRLQHSLGAVVTPGSISSLNTDQES